MMLWVVLAVLTALACLAVLAPLTRGRAVSADPSENDLAVYRDQLAELERDAARGLIGAEEAKQARIEIERRILRADAARRAAGEGRNGSTRRIVAFASVLAVPLVSWGVYAAIGSPDIPGQPLAERMAKNPTENTIEELVARAEAHLMRNPDDARGWQVVAPIYLRLGRTPEAINAYRNAIRLAGSTSPLESGLGEAIAAQAGGQVTADAADAFRRALGHDPADAKARFFLAMALAQEGKTAEATEAWRAMLAALPADSPWRGVAEQAIGRAVASAPAGPTPAAPGPSPDEVEAASGMSPAERAEMIETMVASLDARLRDNPADADGWRRLVRSYLVLGRDDAARDALSRGVEALGRGTPPADNLLAFAAGLGLEGEEVEE